MLDAVLALNETDTKVFDFASQAAPPADEPAGHITVPNAHLLFNGDFQRVGTNDLKIVGDDGASFFIRDYFAADKLSHLISPEGATLSASVVAALAGPLAPGQSAQAGAQPAGQPVIGRVDALSGSCTVVRNGVSVALNIGDTVRKGDVVQTAGGSAVAIVFADGSTFSLNANARMVLDEFVYNAGGAGNSALISLVQGTFSFVAGQVAKTGDMRVDTPVATMGIRGTAVLVEISANDGQTRFSVMTEPDGTTGSFNLYDKTSGTLIGTVSSSQIGWLVTPAGPLQVVAQQVQKTPAQLAQELGIVQQIFTIFNNNQQNPFTPDPNDPGRRGDNPNDPNPQTAQGGGGGSGGLFAGGDTSEGSPPGIVNGLPPSGTHVVKLPPLPGAPPPVIPDVVTVVVTPNAAPVAVNDPDGSSGGGDVIENDSDPEGSVIVVKTVRHIEVVEGGQEVPGPPVTVSAAGATIEGTYGTLTIHPDGTYTFSPHGETYDSLAEGVGATDKFQYTISDPFGATATAVLSINLTGVNDAPEAVSDTANIAEGGSAGNVLANDTDPDTGDAISVVSARHVYGEGSGEPTPITGEGGTAIEGTYGTLYLHTDGTYTFEPNATFDSLPNGQQFVEKFKYTIEDEHGVEASAILSINLTGANDAPVATDDTAQNGPEGFPAGTVLTNDVDPDGDAISVTKVQHWVNGEPSGEPVTINTEDEGGTAIEGTYGTLYLHADGTYTFEPNEAFASIAQGEPAVEKFQYTISDPFGATATAVLTINLTGVNDAPVVAHPISDTSVDAGAELDFTLLAYTFTDVDNNTTLTYTATLANGDLLPEWLTFDANTQTFSGTPPYEFGGQQLAILVTASDGELSASDQFVLTINAVTPPNNAPTAIADTDNVSAAGLVDSKWTLGDPLATGNVLTNDTDPDTDDPLKVIGVRAGDHSEGVTGKVNTVVQGTYGFLLLRENGSYVYTLNNLDPDTIRLGQEETGTEIFTYTIQDADGLQSTTTLTINVHGANNAPIIIGGGGTGSITEDEPINSISGTLTKIDIDNDDTADNDSWSVEARQGQGQNGSHTVHGTYGKLTIDQNGQWTYVLDNGKAQQLGANDKYIERFTVAVTDSHGASDTQIVTLTVRGSNDAPVAEADKAVHVMPDGAPVSLNIASPTDVDFDTLTITVTAVPNADVGVITISDQVSALTAGTHLTLTQLAELTFHPNSAGSESGVFSYTISDGNGGSASQSISISVAEPTSANQRQIITFDDVSVTFETPIFNYAGFSWNNFYVLNGTTYAPGNGYDLGTVSEHNVAFNAYGNPASINGEDFDVAGLYVTAAWRDALPVTITAYDDGQPIFNQSLLVDMTGPTWVTLDLKSIDSLNFATPGGLGNQIALDDVTIGTTNKVDLTIHGSNGNDILFAGAGDDTLTGGYGNDLMSGGHGNDTFVFAQNSGHDTITDFVQGQDKIALYDFNAEYVLSHITYDDDGARIDLGNNQSILLQGFSGQLSPLTQSDFIFHNNGNLFV